MIRWLLALLRRRRDHRPRAERLVLALPPPPMEWKDGWYHGLVDVLGRCTRCGGNWEATCRPSVDEYSRGRCRLLLAPPVAMPIAGPGVSCRR